MSQEQATDIKTPTVSLALMDPALRARVESGELTAHPGQKPERPVLRDAMTGALVKGTGRAPKAGDPLVASKAASAMAYKHSKSYQEAMDLLMSVDAGPDVKGSYAWLYDKAMWAAQGAPQEVKTICPHWVEGDMDSCQNPQHAQRVITLKPDGQLIFKLLELKHGRAKETVEVTGSINHMVEIMESREVPFLVYDVTEAEEAERTAAVDAVIEGSFREVPDDGSGGTA